MQAKAHLTVCELARNAMPEEHREFLSLLWEGIEAGATRPHEFPMVGERDEDQYAAQHALTHRCYVDSDDPRDQCCPREISRYATGTVSLIEDFARDRPEGARDGAEFRHACGAFFGVIAHLVADLWTPVHLGRNLQSGDLRYRHRRGFHWGVEADLDKAAAAMEGPLEHAAQRVSLDSRDYARLAAKLYRRLYLGLPAIYGKNMWAEDVRRFAKGCVAGAACTTADTWLTIAASCPAGEALGRLAT